MGWLTCQFGRTIDSLVHAQMVLSTRDIVDRMQQKITTNPTSLGYSRCGGGGNCGVVTHFTFKASEVASAFLVARFTYPLNAGEEVCRCYQSHVESIHQSISAFVFLSCDDIMIVTVDVEPYVGPSYATCHSSVFQPFLALKNKANYRYITNRLL